MSSSTAVNYIIRPNKNVERKLIFNLLEKLNTIYYVNEFQYIGFGGFVFSDFILAHKLLGITKLFSMEKEGFSRRAEFNKPYKCINVIGKKSSEALTDIDIENKESIIWLDYDSGIQGPIMDDCAYISERASSRTCLFVTVNASCQSINNPSRDNDEAIENLKHYAGNDMVPADIKPKDMSDKNYPSTLAKVVLTRINNSVVNSSRGVEFRPLVFFSYKDNVPMITVGGIFLNDNDKKILNDEDLFGELFYVKGDERFNIDIPPLTTKEKICLDALIPNVKLSAKVVSKKLKFEMSENHLEAYKQFYNQYPVFGEIAF